MVLSGGQETNVPSNQVVTQFGSSLFTEVHMSGCAWASVAPGGAGYTLQGSCCPVWMGEVDIYKHNDVGKLLL